MFLIVLNNFLMVLGTFTRVLGRALETITRVLEVITRVLGFITKSIHTWEIDMNIIDTKPNLTKLIQGGPAGPLS